MRLCAALVAALAVALATGDAAAQFEDVASDFDVERFRLASDGQGILDVESGNVEGQLAVNLALWIGYADDPLNVYRDSPIERERVASLVSHRMGGNLIGSVSVADRFQLGIDVPLILSQDQALGAVGGPMDISSFGLGDLRLLPKVQFLERETLGFDLALVLGFSLPTSGSEDYFGDGGPMFAPELAISAPLSDKLRVAANLGLRMREEKQIVDLTVDDEIYGHVGAGYMVHEIVEMAATLSSATASSDLFGAFNRNYSELRGGVSVRLGEIVLFGAAGAGTSEGFGTPDWRVLAGARVTSELRRGRRTAANRRIADNENDPSRSGAFLDSDGDSLVDDRDQCPLVAENFNGVEDDDGCPEETTGSGDGTSKPDVNPDPDGDGIVGADDKCPDEAGPVSSSGCPEPDGDGDGVADRLDNCPAVAGTAENYGCADEQLVRLTGSGLEVLEKVYFLTDKSTIRPRSYRLLRNVAAVLLAHPEIGDVIVEGHTDDRGSDAYNLDLSERRAKAVRNFLIAANVPGERLQAIGRGEADPKGDNTTEDGRAANRRVEFVLANPVEGVKQID